MAEQTTIVLSEDEALILFEWLHDVGEKPPPGSAEWVVAHNIICILESALAAPFSSNYDAILAAARSRVQQEIF